MDLTTRYLGIELRTPIVPSASPLSENIDRIKQMEDAGASAVVLRSLFEEQLSDEAKELNFHLTGHKDSFAEALSFFPEHQDFQVGPEAYLKLVHDTKASVDIPVFGSLNGTSEGGWIDFALQIQDAGADAIELNIYTIPTDMEVSPESIEQTTVNILRAVKSVVSIPVAIKLSPFHGNMANMAKKLDEAGADGLVLFNRFYQSDIDLEKLDMYPRVQLSSSRDLNLPLTWIGILWDRIKADLAATSGIHTEQDVLKMLMVGASVTMLCSVLLEKGIDHIRRVEKGLQKWMEDHEYESVNQMQGSMSQKNCSDPDVYKRAQYIKAIQRYRV